MFEGASYWKMQREIQEDLETEFLSFMLRQLKSQLLLEELQEWEDIREASVWGTQQSRESCRAREDCRKMEG